MSNELIDVAAGIFSGGEGGPVIDNPLAEGILAVGIAGFLIGAGVMLAKSKADVKANISADINDLGKDLS